MTATVAGAGSLVETVDRSGTSFNMHLLLRCRILVLEAGGADSHGHQTAGGPMGVRVGVWGIMRLYTACCIGRFEAVDSVLLL